MKRKDRKLPSKRKRAGAKGVVGRPFAKGASGNPKGQFPKGVSGNPGGRPKADPELVSVLQQGNMVMLEILWKRAHSENETISLRAALGWLAKTMPDAAVLEISGPGGGPVAIETMRERLAMALIKKFGPPQTSAEVVAVPALPEKAP